MPQFRARVFMWAAMCGHQLPQYPLPTHDIAAQRGAIPKEWKDCVVGFDDEQCKHADVKPAVILKHVLTDLPAVTHDADDSVKGLQYLCAPDCDFQTQVAPNNNLLIYQLANIMNCTILYMLSIIK